MRTIKPNLSTCFNFDFTELLLQCSVEEPVGIRTALYTGVTRRKQRHAAIFLLCLQQGEIMRGREKKIQRARTGMLIGTGQCHTQKGFLTGALKSPKSMQFFKKKNFFEGLGKSCSLV